MKKIEKIKIYTLQMESLGKYLTFRNRPRKVLYSWKEPKKEPVKDLNLKKGTEEGTGEGSWLWLSLKRPIGNYFEASLRSTQSRDMPPKLSKRMRMVAGNRHIASTSAKLDQK